MLFVGIVSGDRAKKLIGRTQKLLIDRLDRATVAINQGNGSLATLAPDLASVAEIQKIQDKLDRTQLSRRHQLNALLGLAPHVQLTLSGRDQPKALSTRLIHDSLDGLADRRPDLIALQYGYRSQDSKLSQAFSRSSRV